MRQRAYGPNAYPSHVESGTQNFEQWNLSYGRWVQVSQQTTTYSTSYTGGHVSGTMDDVVTPNFAKIRDNGGIVNSPMEQVKIDSWTQPVYCDARAYYESSKRKISHSVIGSFDPIRFGCRTTGSTVAIPAIPTLAEYSEDEIEDLSKQSTTKAWANASSAPLNLWIAIGEFNETLRTIQHLLTGVRDILSAFRLKTISPRVAKRWNRRAQVARDLSGRWRKSAAWEDLSKANSAWLELRYGLRPLVYDMIGAIEALNSIGKTARQRFHDERELDDVETVSATLPVTFGPLTVDVRTTRTRSCFVRSGLLCNPIFDTENLLTLLGLGEAAKALWDLTPYSFVVDWFTNVGDIISAWSPSVHIQPLASWCVVQTTDNIKREVMEGSGRLASSYSGVPIKEGTIQLVPGYASIDTTCKWRSPNPPRALIPSFNLRATVLNAVDLASLAAQIAQNVWLDRQLRLYPKG